MYYLLSDNIIVDENRFKNIGCSIRTQEKGLSKYLYLTSYFREHFLGTIKKQSENVYDLIEVGDLLKIKQPKEALERYAFAEYNEQENNYASYIKDGFPNKITAIYKPDANGNYIKAWEKKDGSI